MDIPSQEQIPFNTFYLIEFFKLTLEKIKGKVADSHYKLLEKLSSYLLKENTIVEGLESVAQYQNTNDLAIFLFDMIERANDYGPKIVYNTLPDLAEDFHNLYSLMMEDDECIKTMQKIVSDFQTKFGEIEKEKQLEEFMEMAVNKDERIPDDTLTFEEYYKKEMLANFDKRLLEQNFSDPAQIKQVAEALINADAYENIDVKNKQSVEILNKVSSLLPKKTDSFSTLSQNIDINADALLTIVKQLRDEMPDNFANIISTGLLLTKEVKPKDIADKKTSTSVDSLLVEYFKSEVEDSYSEIKALLSKRYEEVNKDENIEELIAKFKVLKEVSMIHGYSGLEHVAQLLNDELALLKKSGLHISEQSVTIFENIFSDLLVVENFASKAVAGSHVKTIKDKIVTLKETFITPAEIVTEEPEKNKILDDLIAISDRTEFLGVVKSFLDIIAKRAKELHSFDKPTSKDDLTGLMNRISVNAHLFHSNFKEKFLEPIIWLYQSIEPDEKTNEQLTSSLDSAWDKISETDLDSIDFDALSNFINSIQVQIGQAKDFGIEDPESHQAFIETIEKSWDQNKSDLINQFESGKQSEELYTFIDETNQNLKLLDYTGYLPFIDFIQSNLKSTIDSPVSNEIAIEFDQAFSLFIERLKHQGKNGNCDDIIDALNDVMIPKKAEEPSVAESESVTEIEKEQVSESDDLTLFKEETKVYLKNIHDQLQTFSETQDRKCLSEIENASHSVRTAAHYLNLQDISKLAATIEEIAELFGQSELPMPDTLGKDLRTGVETIEKLILDPKTESLEIRDMLEGLLDNIVIEDMGKSEPDSHDQFGFENDDIKDATKKRKSEEKPLFAEGADEDEELLEIFKEESVTFLNTIHESNEKLLEKPDNKEAASSMGYAAHSLKSASKMLGFREISQITDGLEVITDAINNQDVKHTKSLYDKIEEAIDILKRLSEGNVLKTEEISGIIYDLEPENWQSTEDEVFEDETVPENVVEIFVEEARELLEGLNKDFLEIEKMPESEMILSNILRRMHTLKGSAYISKFNQIGDLAHKLEDYFQIYKQKDDLVKNDMLNPAFMAIDLISDIVDNIADNDDENIDQLTVRLAEIDNKMFMFQDFGESTPTAKETETRDISKIKTPEKKKGDEENIIKISTEYMDKLVDMASELMINQTQLGAHLHTLKEVLHDIEGEKRQMHGAENILEDAIEFGVLSKEQSHISDREEEVKKVSDNIKDVVRAVNMIHGDLNKLTEELEQNVGRISSISKLLHSDMLKTRMVPVENLFNRYPRAIRDMAQKQNKKVNLVIEDNNTEMDRAMVEGLSEPILHIIRNAVDHGLETPSERKAVKKAETGTLLLKAHQEKNQIIIDIEDDGRGINIESVKKKIVERELAQKAQVDKMSEAEVLDYIFYPEFSTREETTEVSGRGIGLDAVSNQIQKLKGNIRIKTERDIGTSFSLRVPLTLIISQALMVKVNLQSVAIPVIAVQESIQFDKKNIIRDEDKNYIRVRGRLLPYIHLSDILKFSAAEEIEKDKSDLLAVVLYDAGVSMALGIDELVGRQEVVIKSLGSHLQNVDYVAGGTILANGDVALILDYALVIRTIEMHFFGKVSDRQLSKKVTQKQTESSKKSAEKTEEKTTKKDIPPASAEKDLKDRPVRKIKVRTVKDRKPKILIVDDSNSVRNFVGSILERNGFATIKSTNGTDALEKMAAEKVDLMITDLEMPKMHGFDLISTIRSQKKHDNLPIIILTGRAGMKHRQTGEELGANAFIVKPFKEKDLLQSLSEFIKIG